MPPTESRSYQFGDFKLDTGQKLLFRDGRQVPLTNKGYEVLLALVEAKGRLVEKERLMRVVWPDTFVEEGNLTFQIHALRRILDDQAGVPQFVETVPRRGYRMAVEIFELPPVTDDREMPGHSRGKGEWLFGFGNRRLLVLTSTVMLTLIFALVLTADRIYRAGSTVSGAPAVPRPLTTYAGSVQSPAFSPDGERIAFSWTGPPSSGTWNLYVKLVGAEPPLRLTNDSGIDLAPAWSPDGLQIAYLHEDPQERHVGIYAVGSLGGPARKLLELKYARYFDLSWSADGEHIAFAEKKITGTPYDDLNGYAVSLLDVATGETRQVTFPPEGMSDHRFAFSPDGKLLAFLRHGYQGGVGIFLVPANGGTPRLVYAERSWIGHLAWSADGRSLVFTSQRDGGSRFFRIGIEGGSSQPILANEELVYMPAISRQGRRFAYVREYFDSDLFRMNLDERDRGSSLPQPFIATARVETCPAFSPDGRKMAFLSDRSGKRELWLSDADGSNETQLTDFFAWSTSPPSWSADSKRLLFYGGHGPGGTGAGIFILNLDDKSIRRVPAKEEFVAPRWSRDGKWIYASSGMASEGRMWRISPSDGGSTEIVHTNAALPQESMDGRFIYYIKWPAGIWRVPAAGGAEEVVLPEFQPHMMNYWQVTNDGIFFINNNATPYATMEFYSFVTRKRQILSSLSGSPTTFNGGLTVSPDRKQVVYSQDSRSASEIMLVENFR